MGLKIIDSVHSNSSQAHAGKSFSKVLVTSVRLRYTAAASHFAKTQTSKAKYVRYCTNISDVSVNTCGHIDFSNRFFPDFDKSPFDTLKSETKFRRGAQPISIILETVQIIIMQIRAFIWLDI